MGADAAGETPLAQAGAVLSIDLGAIRANYRILRDRLAGAACGAVVKADGYGIGAPGVARALAAEGCRDFFVAHVDEGIFLRGTVPDAAIFVLNGLPPGSEPSAAAAGLTAVANSPEQLAAWQAEARRRGERLPVALQVDTGMSRLGMTPADFRAAAQRPEALAGLDPVLLISHLAAADEPGHPANAAQLEAFRALRALFPRMRASLANSSGIFLGPDFAFDLARPGAALYGINPTPGQPNPMRAAIALSAKVIQTRTVPAGAGVGYGHGFVADRPMRLATVALGYADGWPRRAAAAAFFEGRRLPFVGRVSMDSIVLDIGALAEDRLAPGDLVELIGPHQSVDDVAALAGTIGYEILTGLGNRFARVIIGG